MHSNIHTNFFSKTLKYFFFQFQPCEIIKLTVQHDPLPPGFMEITVRKEEGEKLGMIVKGGLRGQPGNPHDQSDEGVFCVKVNPGSIASRDPRIKV